MGKYVDGFVLVVPHGKTKEYKKMAAEGRDIWMKFGALEYYECKGDDLKTKARGGHKAREFTEMTGANSDEAVWFSFIIYKSRKHRDAVNAKVMEEINKLENKNKAFQMPFDIKRMAYGGFETVVEG